MRILVLVAGKVSELEARLESFSDRFGKSRMLQLGMKSAYSCLPGHDGTRFSEAPLHILLSSNEG